ncbi:MAG: helix-turn-helix domain-containing protein [Propionibacteriaceae bacterium]|nr:helix-turn-helix domain-containing protein [Propionibacteriaceae bacterium]
MRYHGRVGDAAALGQMLAQARMTAGLSQREMAKHLGVSQRYIWQMESGEPNTYAIRLFQAMRVAGMALTAEFGDPRQDATS